MQNIINSASRNAGSLYLVLIIGILLGVSGCENPGSVGSNLTNKGGADVVIDTFSVDGISTNKFNWYSGAYAYFSAGRFNDPLFGNMNAIGMIKPALPVSGDSTVSADAAIKMRLIIDDDRIYGNTSAPQQFEVYEITEPWRGKAWKLNNDIQVNSSQRVASFTVEDEDSLDVELSSDWIDSYREYAEGGEDADSLYQYEAFGLALVPANSGKILPLNSSSTRFVIENPAADTFTVSSTQWAYSFSRENPSLPQNSVPLYSTYESVLNFTLDLSQLTNEGIGISKGELVLYQNNEAMEQSLQPATRPQPASARLHIVNAAEAPENIAPGNPIAAGTYSTEDGAYHFNITSIVKNILLNGMPEGQEFFITFPNNGTLRPSLIYADGAPAEKSPKLIITSIKNNDS